MKKGGERFEPYNSINKSEPIINLERYLYAMSCCKDKVVLDAGCGSGLGSYLYSLVAKKVIAVDYKEAMVKYPYKHVKFVKMDLEKEKPPKADICVAIEVVEHLENPEFFMENLQCEELVFSVPMASLATSSWHKYAFTDMGSIVTFFSRYYDIETHCQYNKWIYGHGNKRNL